MSRQTSGKTLLRNVIRHTDAHNKVNYFTFVCSSAKDYSGYVSYIIIKNPNNVYILLLLVYIKITTQLVKSSIFWFHPCPTIIMSFG